MRKQIKIFGVPVFESRSDSGNNLSNPSESFLEFLSPESKAGTKVTQNTALTFSAVWACVRIISNTVAQLPFGVYRIDDNGNRYSAPKHKLYHIIHNEPNQIMSSFTWRQVMQAQATLRGNSYSIIKRDGSYRPIELQLIKNPMDVTPFEYEGRLFYKVIGYDQPFQAHDIFHIRGLGFDGVQGKSVLTVARESIGAALAMQEYGSTIFKTGGSKRIALKHQKFIKDPDSRKNIRESWENTYSGASNSHKVAIIDGGFDIQEVGMNPEDALFISSREFSVNEIARYFGLIMDLLATDKNPTYASAEQRAIDFIKYTMTPWLVTWESETNRKLFPDYEKGRYYSKFSIGGLLRGDAAARTKYYRDMFYIGALSRDEVRKLEDMNNIAGGEKYYLQSNMTEADKLMEIHQSKKTKTNE